MLADIISRIRRNHGLEHATIHVLSERHKNFSAQGNSNHNGFALNIYGSISETDVANAVHEAYTRMKNGETHLAVHPNCGTVLLTTGTMVALAVQAVFGFEQVRRRKSAFSPIVLANALPSAVMAVVATLLISKPIGMAIQEKYTTDGNLGSLEVVEIKRVPGTPVTRLFQTLLAPGRKLTARSYRIETRDGI